MNMLDRVKEAKPDFIEEKGMSESELLYQLTSNACIGQAKFLASTYRTAIAKTYMRNELKNNIRTLANGGDRFHPYL
jgi:hypothetical protein